MHVNDVVFAALENLLELLAKPETQSHARLRSVEVDRLASSYSNDMRLGDSAFDVRSDDIDVMPETASFAREKVNVFADAAEMRIVVLGNERDAKGTCETSRDTWKRRGGGEVYGTRQVVTTR